MKDYDFIEVRVADYRFTPTSAYFRKKESVIAYISDRVDSTADKRVHIVFDGGQCEASSPFLQKYGIDMLFSVNGITTIKTIGVRDDLYGCPHIEKEDGFQIKILMRKFED